MSPEALVTKWLKENTDLVWTRTGGDEPQVRQDRIFINRSEGYEIRDFIVSYYEECRVEHKAINYAITFKEMLAYKKGLKVKTEDLLNHLKGKFHSS